MSEPARNPRVEGVSVDTKRMDRLISSIVGNICKEKGEGSATVLGDTSLRPMVKDWLSTGSPSLDRAVSPSGKGIPVGRLIEIYGHEASSKTTISWGILASTQKKGGVAILIEPESAAFDMTRAKAIGLDPDTLVYASPGVIEDVFAMMESVIDTALAEDPNRLVTIVWDSVAATSTRSEIEGEFGESTMGIHARLMSQGLRKIMPKVKESSGITLVFLNQIRQSIGGYGGTVTFGGKALAFYASVRISLRAAGTIKGEADKVVGVNFEATISKNKVSPPFRKASYRMMFDASHGGAIDYLDSLLSVAIESGVITQSGAWLAYGDKKFYRKDFKEVFGKYPEIIDKL